MKYTLEFKLECIDKYKKGIHIDLPPNARCKERDFFMHKVRDWNRLYDLHGIDGLKHNKFNHAWTKEERFKLVAQVLAGKTFSQVSFESNVKDSILSSWVRRYREKGINGLELRKGRKPKVPDMPMKKKVKLAPSEKEELELLRARNEYLEAENAYLKKTRSLGEQEGSCASQGEKAKVIKEMIDSKLGFRLSTLLKAASLSRSTYYFEINKPDLDIKKSRNNRYYSIYFRRKYPLLI